jgi:hypothetical protein
LFSAFHIEETTALLSLSDVNKRRKKVNKCKDLKINEFLWPPKPL